MGGEILRPCEAGEGWREKKKCGKMELVNKERKEREIRVTVRLGRDRRIWIRVDR